MRLAIALSLAVALPAQAQEFRWASQTDPNTMDPHAGNSTPVFSFLNNVYEGLVRRDRDMAIEPSLATDWAPVEDGAGWRFTLRQGVTFHDGAAFTAEDVVFSYERASSETADTSSWFAGVASVEAVDDYTVEILTDAPNPIFPDSIANWMMMDSGWATENGAERPAPAEGNFATLNANGTGPYRLVRREPGVETVLDAHAEWWGEDRGNVQTASFSPIENAATAVAALLSGEVDLVNPVPVQDAERVEQADGVSLNQGIEARVIMLGFAHAADGLVGGETDGNPFADPRVRQAVGHAVNVPAILQTIMRGAAEPANQLVSDAMRGYTDGIARPEHDPEQARTLLAEAGYPDGFSFLLKCPNDRYINDESVCQAVVGMLAQIGLEARLDAIPVRNYWPELREGDFDMYLLGWSPGTFDAEHPFRFLVHTPGDTIGTWNFGGFSNDRVDELLPQIQSEIDDAARQRMLDEVANIVRDETVYVPLYVQPLLWGVRDGVELTQRPDDFVILRWVTVE